MPLMTAIQSSTARSERVDQHLLSLSDEIGQSIARVRLLNATGRTVEIGVDRRNNSSLLDYVYGDRPRIVWIDTGELRVRGQLRTTWKGRRRWFVQLG